MKGFSRISGFTLFELVVALGIIAIVATISTGGYIYYLRSAETVDAIATVAVLREQVGIAADRQNPVDCDNTLVAPADLENPYMDLAITSIAPDPANAMSGTVPGLAIMAKIDTHGPGGLAAARLLREELQNQGTSIVHPVLTDSVVSFSLPLNSTPICSEPAPATLATQTATSTTGVQALTPPPTLSVTESQAASDIVNIGLKDPVFADAVADALAKARASGSPVSLPASPEAVETLVKCNISTPTPCEDNYTGDCTVDFPGMCTDPVRACAAARICPQSCGYCQGVSAETQAFLDTAYDNLMELSPSLGGSLGGSE